MVEHYGTWPLRTERLVLRTFRMEDAEKMYRNWASSPAATKYLSWYPHKDVTVTLEVLSGWCAQYDDDDFYQWAIVLKELGEPIGSISFHHIKPDGVAEMGCCIGPKWWRSGIATEATERIMVYGFEKVGMSEIRAWHAAENIGSRRTLEKLGLVPIKDRTQLIKGTQVPGTTLGITREQFFAHRCG